MHLWALVASRNLIGGVGLSLQLNSLTGGDLSGGVVLQ